VRQVPSFEPIRVFIGYDEREAVAFHVCCQSIIETCSRPVQITPLALRTMERIYNEHHGDGSNAFIYSRFLVPYLCGFSGWALYLDGDMLVRRDLNELWELRRITTGVQVVKHDYRTRYPIKYLGASNADYPRKNWSSVMLWNCSLHPNRTLTPGLVAATGEYLHRFSWLPEDRIGELPAEWNWLCREYPENHDAKLYHFTTGTPCFEGYGEQEGAGEWFDTYRRAIVPMRAD
jgi:lipopolysaccharide biosynthesis glycosyltransferase